MALVLADRVNETTTTAGTGTLTLAGAVTGYQSFSVVGNANTTYYTIVSQTTSEWEVGIGTYTSSGTTLSRDTVLASSAGGTTKVTLSAGTKFVFCDYPAGKAVYQDASGNVGIGTTSPSGKLTVDSSSTIAGLLRNSTATSYTSLRLYNDQNSSVRSLEIDYSGSTYSGALITGGPSGEQAAVGTTGAYPLVLYTGNNARIITDGSGNVGVGVIPSAWISYQKGVDFGGAGNYGGLSSRADYVSLSNNAYLNASGNWTYKNTSTAQEYYQSGGTHVWRTAASGTAGTTISWAQSLYLDASSNLVALGSMQAPIFYDSNNTAYYVDPASGTVLGGQVSFAGGSYVANNGDVYARRSSGTTGVYYFADGSSKYLYWDGTNYIFGSAGSIISSTSFRAPIFYDSDDTTYYIDPASTSNSALRMRGGALFGPNTTWSAYLSVGTNGNASTSYASVATTNGNLHLDAASGTEMYLNYYAGNNVYYAYGSSIRGGFYTDGSVRGSLFYDFDNTGYYVNPNSTSNIFGMTMGSTLNMWAGSYDGLITFGLNSGWRCGIRQYDSSNAELRMYASNALGKIFFATGYDGASTTTLPTDGMMLYSNNVGIGNFSSGVPSYDLHVKGTGYADSDLRAPIFYNSNNTGYYTNQASTSNYNVLSVQRAYAGYDAATTNSFSCSNWFRSSGDTGWYNATYAGGIYMIDSTWVRTYNDRQFYSSSVIQAGQSVRAPIFYDADNTGYYLDPAGASSLSTGTCTGTWSFTAATYAAFMYGNGSTASSTSVGLQIYSTGGNGAIMAFHRGGYYAINMGVDSDNVLRIGGWSASSNRFQMDSSGNLTMAGNVTAYSDIRIKTDILVIENALEKVSKIRGVTFIRTDEGSSDARQSGVIAQEVELVLPEVVSEDASGIKNVAYGNMAGLFIEAIKELKAEIEELKSRIH